MVRPRGVYASEWQVMPSPVFVLLSHRGHENLPRKSKHACELAGHATFTGGAGHDSMPSTSGHLLMPGVLNPPTGPPMGTLRPRGERFVQVFQGEWDKSQGTCITHIHTCVQTHTHWHLCVPTPTPAWAHPDRRAHAPAPLPWAHPLALDQETQPQTHLCMLQGPGNFYEGWGGLRDHHLGCR